MEDYQKIIGERIRTYRKATGMSQNDLAQKVGMHYAYIGQVERGEKNMTIKTLCKISEALGVLPERLISGVGGTAEEENEKAESLSEEIVRIIRTHTDEMLEELRKI